MVAALANLTLNDELFYRVVPNDQDFDGKYTGSCNLQPGNHEVSRCIASF